MKFRHITQTYEYRFLFLLSRVSISSEVNSILIRGGLYESNSRFENFNDLTDKDWFQQLNCNIKTRIEKCNEISLEMLCVEHLLEIDGKEKSTREGSLEFIYEDPMLNIFIPRESYSSIVTQLAEKKSLICTVNIGLDSNGHLNFLSRLFEESRILNDEIIKDKFKDECRKNYVGFDSVSLNFR